MTLFDAPHRIQRTPEERAADTLSDLRANRRQIASTFNVHLIDETDRAQWDAAQARVFETIDERSRALCRGETPTWSTACTPQPLPSCSSPSPQSSLRESAEPSSTTRAGTRP